MTTKSTSRRRSHSVRTSLLQLSETTTEVLGTVRVNGDKVRVERNTKTGELSGWNGSEGRTTTENELNEGKRLLGL